MKQTARAWLKDRFSKLNELEMREHGLSAVKVHADRQKDSEHRIVSLWHWYRLLLASVAPDLPAESGVPDAITRHQLEQQRPIPETNGVVELHQFQILRFWRWMEQAGFALAYGDNRDCWVLTAQGVQRLSSDHPCRPGAMERLRAAHEVEFRDSLNRLEDAQQCFESGLHRAAVVLLGLAYEEMLQGLAARLHVKLKASSQARERLDAVRKAIEQGQASNPDAKSAAMHALNVAYGIRSARNNAAHRAASEWDSVVVDELLTDGLRSYAKLAGYKPPPPPRQSP